MNYADLIIGIFLVWGAIQGFRKGLVYSLALLIGLYLGLSFAFLLVPKASVLLLPYMMEHERALSLFSYLFAFLTIFIGILFLGKLLEGIIKITALGIFNRISGSIFGILKYALLLSLLLWIASPVMQTSSWFISMKEKSFLLSYLEKIVAMLMPFLKKIVV